jgi:hypothetical protein
MSRKARCSSASLPLPAGRALPRCSPKSSDRSPVTHVHEPQRRKKEKNASQMCLPPPLLRRVPAHAHRGLPNGPEFPCQTSMQPDPYAHPFAARAPSPILRPAAHDAKPSQTWHHAFLRHIVDHLHTLPGCETSTGRLSFPSWAEKKIESPSS